MIMLDKLENNDVVLLVGRVLLGLIYALAVIALLSGKVPVDFAAAGAKIVALPAIVVWIGYIVKVVSGLCVVVGFQTRLAALVLVVFTLITAFNYHVVGDSTFMKEMSMIGGLLILAAVGAGKLSVDGKFGK
jgi:putative oxidoreductase